MKGDFSRFTFMPRRHYDGVLMQQGRLQTDADWNEQGAIAAERQRRALGDIIGPSGVPRDAPGFGIRGHGGLLFDGTRTYLEIDAPAPHRLHKTYSLEGWIKVMPTGRHATLITRLFSASGRPGGFRLGLSAHDKLQFERVEQHRIDLPLEGDFVEEIIVIDKIRLVARGAPGREAVPADRYVHIAVVCDDAEIRLFLNGVLDGEHHGGEGVPFDSSAFVIGCDLVDGEGRNHFAGAIDRLRLWDIPLDAEDIARLARSMAVERDAQPLCHWCFGSEAHPIQDLSGARHNSRGTRLEAAHLPVPAEPEIWIGAGRCYVEGVRSDIEEDIRFDRQAGLPGARLPTRAARERYPGPYLFYLDSWDRVVTAAEDTALRDSALGGLDTAARAQIVNRVRLVRGGTPDSAAAAHRQSGTLRIAQSAHAPLAANHLVRVEIHDSGFPQGMPVPAHGHPLEGLALAALGAGGTVTLAEPGHEAWRPGRLIELVRHGLAHPLTGIVRSVEIDDDGLATLHLVFETGAELKGNPAHWRLRPIASFKWSLDNGAWLFPVTDIDPTATRITIEDGADRRGLLQDAGWIEYVDEDSVLGRQPGMLRRVHDIDDDAEAGSLTVTLDSPVADPFGRAIAERLGARPCLRHWSAIDLPAGAAGCAPLALGSAVPLEAGIEIACGPGFYQTEDFWTIALRQTLDWPCDAAGTPRFMPPHGVHHRLAPLAAVWFHGGSVQTRDLRRVFRPLTEEHRRVIVPELLVPAEAPPAAIEAEIEHILEETGFDPVAVADMAPTAVLPGDQRILTRSDRAPPGWRFDGATLAIAQDEPAWHPIEPPLALDRPHALARLDGEIFCLDAAHGLHSIDLATGRRERRRGLPLEDVTIAGIAPLGNHLHVLGWAEGTPMHWAYHPAEDAWMRHAPMPTPRRRYGLAALKGRLYAAGGVRQGTGKLTDTIEVFAPDRHAWLDHAPLPHACADGALIAAEGRLYLVGGVVARALGTGHHMSHHVAAFSPGTGKWLDMPPLAFARGGALLAVTGRRLHVIGGHGPDGTAKPDELLDLAAGRWIEAPQPDTLHATGALFAIDGTLYRFDGSETGGAFCTFEQRLYLHARLP